MICEEVCTDLSNGYLMAIFYFVSSLWRFFGIFLCTKRMKVTAILHYWCCFVTEDTQMCDLVRAHTHTHTHRRTNLSCLVCLVWLIIDLSLLSSMFHCLVGSQALWLCLSGCWPTWKDFQQVDTHSEPKDRPHTIAWFHDLHSCLILMAMWLMWRVNHMKKEQWPWGCFSPKEPSVTWLFSWWSCIRHRILWFLVIGSQLTEREPQGQRKNSFKSKDMTRFLASGLCSVALMGNEANWRQDCTVHRFLKPIYPQV